MRGVANNMTDYTFPTVLEPYCQLDVVDDMLRIPEDAAAYRDSGILANRARCTWVDPDCDPCRAFAFVEQDTSSPAIDAPGCTVVEHFAVQKASRQFGMGAMQGSRRPYSVVSTSFHGLDEVHIGAILGGILRQKVEWSDSQGVLTLQVLARFETSHLD
jgi:hypothetical protein